MNRCIFQKITLSRKNPSLQRSIFHIFILLASRKGNEFCGPQCKNQFNVYKSREKKKGTNRITTKKCLRHFGDCGILNIKKDICANRCPTGATDRRLARLISYSYSRILWSGGRLFLCLIIIFAADGVSETETGQA